MQRNLIVRRGSLKARLELANWPARAKRRDALESSAKTYRLIRPRRRLSLSQSDRVAFALVPAIASRVSRNDGVLNSPEGVSTLIRRVPLGLTKRLAQADRKVPSAKSAITPHPSPVLHPRRWSSSPNQVAAAILAETEEKESIPVFFATVEHRSLGRTTESFR